MEKEKVKEGLIYELMSEAGEAKLNEEMTQCAIEDAEEAFQKLFRDARRQKNDANLSIKAEVQDFADDDFDPDYIVGLEMLIDQLDTQMNKIKVVYKKIFGKDFPQA